MKKLNEFEYEGKKLKVGFVESIPVKDGVLCHVYKFEEENNCDLAIIEIEKGKKTPLQKVLQGDRTVEGYLSGSGVLEIVRLKGEKEKNIVGRDTKLPFLREVKVGEFMQWRAGENEELLVYEICYPPYEEGRYENLPE